MSRLRFALLFIAFAAPACASILGVEELPEGSTTSSTTGSATIGTGPGSGAGGQGGDDAGPDDPPDADTGSDSGAPDAWMPGPCDCPATQAWSKAFQATGDVTVGGVATASSGDVVIAGSVAGDLDIDGHVLDGGGADHDIFVVVLDPCGEYLWARRYGGAGEQRALALALDPITTSHPDAIVLSGSFSGDLAFGGAAAPLMAPNQRAFVARLDPVTGDGIKSFGAGFDPAKSYAGTSVAVAPSGGLFWSGTEDGGAALFVRRLDSGFAVTHQITPACNQCDPSIAVALNGNVALAGRFLGSVDFAPGGPGPLSSHGSTDVYLATLSPAGMAFSEIKAKGYGDPAQQFAAGIAVNAAGRVFAAGGFAGTLPFGGSKTRTSTGGVDAFVVAADSAQSILWTAAFGGGGLAADQRATVIAASGDKLVVAGDFAPALDFGADGGAPLSSAGDLDAFLLRLDPSTGKVLSSESYGGPGTDHAQAVAMDGASSVILAGVIAGQAGFGCGTLGGDGKSIFVVKRPLP